MNREERVQQELALLRTYYADLEHRDNWIRIVAYSLPSGWTPNPIDVAVFVNAGYPGSPPYGIYVPNGLHYKGEIPGNYRERAKTQPPFGGTWAMLSWSPEDGQWKPKAKLTEGSNLLNWVMGFADRFREGK